MALETNSSPLTKTLEINRLLNEIGDFQAQRAQGGEVPIWSYEEQQKKAVIFREAASKLATEESRDIWLSFFPHTPEGITADFKKDILWKQGERVTNILELCRKSETPEAKEFIRLRAPGSEIVPIKNGWEKVVEKWLSDTQEGHTYTIQDFMNLGNAIAQHSSVTADDVKRECCEQSTKHIFAYHFEALSEGGHAHCCGAHANDTPRAVMGAMVQAALYAWATNGEKQVQVVGRRTTTNTDPAAWIETPADYQTFLADHFAKGAVPDDFYTKLTAEGMLYKGENRPSLESVHAALTELNEAFKAQEKEGTTAIISCADDRLGLHIKSSEEDLNSALEVSTLPDHTADIMYVTVGRQALYILNNQSSPPNVYRSTIGAGITNITREDISSIEKQLLAHVPLILSKVMSPDINTKHVYVDVVLGIDEDTENEARVFAELDTIITGPLRKALRDEHAKLGVQEKNLHLNLRIVQAASKRVSIRSFNTHTENGAVVLDERRT